MMYLSWAAAGIPLGVYNMVQNLNIALQIQPNILIFLSLVTWSQCKYYGTKWHPLRALLSMVGLVSIIGGIEVGLFFVLRMAWDREVKWPMTLMAVLAAVMLCAGVLRYYWEIYQSRDTKGISFLFVFIDYGGDLVSIVALVFASRLDVLGIVIYSVEASLWIGIQLLGIYFRLLPWIQAKRRHDNTLSQHVGRCPDEAVRMGSGHVADTECRK